jgi:hypothetical protein
MAGGLVARPVKSHVASPQPTEPRVRTTLHPLAVVGLIGAGLMLVLLVVGIALLVVILKDSRDHIRAQDAKTAVLLAKLRAAEPTARQVAPLIDEARPAVRGLGRSIGPLRQAVVATAEAATQLPELAHATAAATTRLPELVNTTGKLARSTISTFAEVHARNLIPASARAAEQTPELLRRSLRVQEATLETQKAALRALLESLDIQRQTLVSVKSIDRKTGGTVPAQGAPVPVP